MLADARLIAAAPEMADVLARLLEGGFHTHGVEQSAVAAEAFGLLARIRGEA
jgi:hypothetical protein